MEISTINDSLEEILLPGDQKRAMLQLIDSKTSNDMKEVIAEIRVLETKISMVRNEIKVMYWVIGIAWAILLFVIAKK